MNFINEDDYECFQCSAKLALNHKEIRKNSGQIRKKWLEKIQAK